MSVLTARPTIAALEKRGLSADGVLRVARLSRDALSSLDHRLPYRNVRVLWEEAAATARNPWFGVHVAEALPHGAYDLFDYLLATAATLGEGLARLTEHVRLIYDHWMLRLEIEPRGARLVASVPTPAIQYDEFAMTLLLVRARQACGHDWAPNSVCVQHDRSQAGELGRVFGCPITFGSARTEIQFRRSVLDLPLVGADPVLASILARFAAALQERLPPSGTLLTRASTIIAERMKRGVPTLATMARSLELPERTLQRRLAELGLTHSGLVDEVRRALALKYIADAGIAITEIAYLLHFGDPSAFYRAFKRWTGQSPRRYRDRLYEAGSASRIGK